VKMPVGGSFPNMGGSFRLMGGSCHLMGGSCRCSCAYLQKNVFLLP
jgi:hypothetical protein